MGDDFDYSMNYSDPRLPTRLTHPFAYPHLSQIRKAKIDGEDATQRLSHPTKTGDAPTRSNPDRDGWVEQKCSYTRHRPSIG